MQAESSTVPPLADEPAAPAIAVISPQFCVGHPIDLTIVPKSMTGFEITDSNGDIMFRVKGKLLSFHERRVLLDAAGTPLITFRPKIPSAHKRWLAYRGESTDSEDLLFTVKLSSFFQFTTEMDVFLASNTKQENRDFKIEPSWMARSCAIYAGTSSNIVAQMRKKETGRSSSLFGKDTSSVVTVYPHVDHAFIVALVVICKEMSKAGSAPSASG